MSKENYPVELPMALENKISRWNYDKSVEKMRELGRQWGKITSEVARELYLAKEYLIRQKGQRKNPDAPNYIQYTWNDYCDEIGISREVAGYWIKKFTPREVSGTGRDVLQIKAPLKEDTTASRALAESRIEKVLQTSKRPNDWTDEEEAEVQRRLKNAQLHEIMERYNAPVVIKPKDYFEDTLRRSKDIAAFKLENHEQTVAQMAIFEHIERFLATFDDPKTKAMAAFNIALKARRRANELAEINFQLEESDGGAR
jgi:hypothetical protein